MPNEMTHELAEDAAEEDPPLLQWGATFAGAPIPNATSAAGAGAQGGVFPG
jgi:hypothetical protein